MTKRRVLIGLLLLPSVARAQTTASAAAVDASHDADRLIGLIKRLAAALPDDRDAARAELMAVPPAHLPALKAAIAAARPLRPEQAESLRRVVTYVLTREGILKIPQGPTAFLGVKFPPSFNADDEQELAGAPISDVLPGFAADRLLESGDMLTGFDIDGQTVWVGPGSMMIQIGRVIKIVGGLKPGTPVKLFVNRGGRSMTFALRLDARPTLATADERDFERLRDQDLQIQQKTTQAEADAEATYVREYRSIIEE